MTGVSSLQTDDAPIGTRLSELGRDAPLPLGSLLRIAIGVARAVARFHARGLVHRDLTPGNVWFSPDSGEAQLSGTGLAIRHARTQDAHPPDVILGTLAYMAPEQTGRLNRSIDARSDLYSLGVIAAASVPASSTRGAARFLTPRWSTASWSSFAASSVSRSRSSLPGAKP